MHCPHAGKGPYIECRVTDPVLISEANQRQPQTSSTGRNPKPQSRVTPTSRTVVENRTPGKRCSKMERSILEICTRPPTQMNCVFPGFNLRRFEDNQAPITSETRSIFSTR